MSVFSFLLLLLLLQHEAMLLGGHSSFNGYEVNEKKGGYVDVDSALLYVYSVDPSHVIEASPTFIPSSKPTGRPSSHPSKSPLSSPTDRPTCEPTSTPSLHPSKSPLSSPTDRPTCEPTSTPSLEPSMQPTSQPSGQPSTSPSANPTHQPVTEPTSAPSDQPSANPSGQPSTYPTFQPSSRPSSFPSSQPSATPTTQPSSAPSESPSSAPTVLPSPAPTSIPTSSAPTSLPTSQPTTLPMATISWFPLTVMFVFSSWLSMRILIKFCNHVTKLRGNRIFTDDDSDGKWKGILMNRLRRASSFGSDTRTGMQNSHAGITSEINTVNGEDLESQHLLMRNAHQGGGGRRWRSYGDLNSSRRHTVYSDDNNLGDNVNNGLFDERHWQLQEEAVNDAIYSMYGMGFSHEEDDIDMHLGRESIARAYHDYLWHPSFSDMVYVNYTETPDNSAGWVKKEKARSFRALGKLAFL